MLTSIIVLVFVASGFVNGFLGFGSGIVAMTIIASTHGLLHAAGVVNICTLVISLVQGWILRRHIRWDMTWLMLSTGVIGVVVGVLLLSSFDADIMTRAVGVAVMAIAAYYLLHKAPPRQHSKTFGAACGLASGALSGAANIGGPPVVAYVYGHPDPPDALKATAQAIFVGLSIPRLIVAMQQGQITADMAWDSLPAIPALVVGLLAGIHLGRRLSPDRFRTVAWIAFGLLGASLAI